MENGATEMKTFPRSNIGPPGGQGIPPESFGGGNTGDDGGCKGHGCSAGAVGKDARAGWHRGKGDEWDRDVGTGGG